MTVRWKCNWLNIIVYILLYICPNNIINYTHLLKCQLLTKTAVHIYIIQFQTYISVCLCLQSVVVGSCDFLPGIWQVLWKTNCSKPDESIGQYRLTTSLCAKSGHKQLPFLLSHPMEIPSDLSTHRRTHLACINCDSCLITQRYTCMHRLPPRETHTHKPPTKSSPTHRLTS